ncbi:hypothetical protein BD414DRAFT_426400 [Trametes punicea]|nr:hypothetical protein BD414DRAFT_426400 [Trametes punicea]
MAHFSWSDSFHAALSSCLPCLKSSDAPSDTEDENANHNRHHRAGALNGALAHVVIPPPRARPDELEGLLADASDDAETLSLHSNIGSDRRGRGGRRHKDKKKRRGGAQKRIRMFGFDLFGRPPAIQLPESDDEGAPADRGGSTRPRPRTISTDTLDSDAAPLDASAIQELSAARHAEALAREEEERRAKEERRRRRREKRELKRAAMARALELHADANEEFEGFQGSGLAYGIPHPFSPSLGSGSGSLSVSDSQDFGPFAQGQLAQPFDADAALAAQAQAEVEADGADFGAESYTSRPRKGNTGTGSGRTNGTQTTSDARSSSTGTSHSYSFAQANGDVAPYNHHFLAQQLPLPRSPLSPESDGVPASSRGSSNGAKKHRRKSTRPKSQSASASGSSNSNTNSQALTASQTASPVSDAPAPSPRVFAPPHAHAQSRHPDGDFEGFPGEFGGSQELQNGARHAAAYGHNGDEEELGREESARAEHLPVASFPSVGLRGVQRTKSDMGVFLARRGDE